MSSEKSTYRSYWDFPVLQNFPIIFAIIERFRERFRPGGAGGTTMTGHVVSSSSGTPLQGAMVAIGQNLKATTDVNGNYLISNVSPGDYTATVTDTNYQTLTQKVTIKQGANSFDFVLQPVPVSGTTYVTGKVTNNSGQPVFNAAVDIRQSGLGPFVALTDANGDYTISNVLAATSPYTLTISALNYEFLTQSIQVISGANTYNFTLTPIPVTHPQAFVNPTTINANSPISYQGTGFLPNSIILIDIEDGAGHSIGLPSITSDPTGSIMGGFSINSTLFSGLSPGPGFVDFMYGTSLVPAVQVAVTIG